MNPHTVGPYLSFSHISSCQDMLSWKRKEVIYHSFHPFPDNTPLIMGGAGFPLAVQGGIHLKQSVSSSQDTHHVIFHSLSCLPHFFTTVKGNDSTTLACHTVTSRLTLIQSLHGVTVEQECATAFSSFCWALHCCCFSNLLNPEDFSGNNSTLRHSQNTKTTTKRWTWDIIYTDVCAKRNPFFDAFTDISVRFSQILKLISLLESQCQLSLDSLTWSNMSY